jgi:protein O-GlcNAc transferase
MNSPIEATVGLALRQLQAGNKEKAKKMLSSALQGHPKNLPALHILGLINAEQGNHKEAALLLKKSAKH